MKIIYNVRLLLLTVLVASLYFVACKKDSADANSGVTQLLSFGPTGASPGDTIRFFGNNLNTVTQIDFQNASVDNKHFVSQSATEIYVVVPVETEKGYVTLKTPTGDIKSKTQFNIGIATTVTSITSTARPGENITIKGNYLNWVTSVTFYDSKVATTFVSQSINELVVKVPDDAQTGTLVLAYSGTDSSYMETKDTLHVTLPQITSLAPNPIKHHANLTITGTNLDLAKKVYFTGAKSAITTFVSQSATALVVTVPDYTVNGKVTLEAASGVKTVSPVDLQVILPVITAIAPSPVKHANNLTITGTNMDLVDKIYFASSKDTITTFVSKTATQVVVKVPASAQDGKVTVEVAGVQAVSADDVKLVWPAVTDMQPNPVDPQANLTITGTNLDLVTAVLIQNADPVKTFISQSATQIVLQVPKGVSEGKITLSVLNSTVTVQSTDVLKINGAVPPPVIALPFYTDAVTSNWNGWSGGGWGGSKDMANTNPVREGDKSIKIDYTAGAWGSPLQLGGGSVSIGSYTTFKISVYGAPGTGGKTIQIVFNANKDGGPSITIVEGKWTDYSIPISTITTESTINEIWVKEGTGTAYTIYVDDIGLN